MSESDLKNSCGWTGVYFTCDNNVNDGDNILPGQRLGGKGSMD